MATDFSNMRALFFCPMARKFGLADLAAESRRKDTGDYRRDEAGQIVKADDHYMDAMRYAIFSDVQSGIVVV